ncbi:hypothetical protein ADL09_32855, partial [Streptomyces sp. NRRL F-7442]
MRAPAAGPPGQPALQDTVGQVQLPLAWMVAPQVLPLPFGLAVSVWALGYVALTFQVDITFAGDGTFIVTVQSDAPLTET